MTSPVERTEEFEINSPTETSRNNCPTNSSIEELIVERRSFIRRLFETYDNTFLYALGLQYFNNGLKAIVALAYMNLFKNYYHLQPAQTQSYTAIMLLPWTPKLVYGVFTDTFPLFGSRKRNYLILMGLL
jgi:hypothetical protein